MASTFKLSFVRVLVHKNVRMKNELSFEINSVSQAEPGKIERALITVYV